MRRLLIFAVVPASLMLVAAAALLSGESFAEGSYVLSSWRTSDHRSGTFTALPATNAGAGALAVDCDPKTQGIQSDCWHRQGETFDVQLYITLSPDAGYAGYDAHLAWDTDILRYTETNNELRDPNCALVAWPAVVDGRPRPKWVCVVSPSAEPAVHAIGLVARAQMTCASLGDTTLDLAGSTFVAQTLTTIEPVLFDATVHCSGPIVVGDANCDGSVNSVDAEVILQVEAGLISGGGCISGADINHDGLANTLDAELILQHEAGLIADFG